MSADMRIGTCGYSFPDWKGTVYPPNLRPSLYLVHYARTLGFSAVELDSSFYHMPSVPLMEALMQKMQPGFLFTVKAHRTMTHEVWKATRPAAPGCPAFPDVSSGLKSATELATVFQAVVLQYPPWFRDTPENRKFLLMTRGLLPRLPLSIEFRDRSWHEGNALTFLQQEHLGYVAVDEPRLRNLLPLIPAVTSDVAYLRLHGRNPNWFGASREERYDYLYSHEELEELLPMIHTMALKAPLMFVMTNNCHRGQAVRNAKDLQSMLLFPDRPQI
jgi:uncharacterized protein YecE (DUF72 family)